MDIHKNLRENLENNTPSIIFEKYKLLSIIDRDISLCIMGYMMQIIRSYISNAARYNLTAATTAAIDIGCLSTIRRCCYKYLVSTKNSLLTDREKIFRCAVNFGDKLIIENIIKLFHPRVPREQAIDLTIKYDFDEDIINIIFDHPEKMLKVITHQRIQIER